MVYTFGPSGADSSWETARERVRADLWRTTAAGLPNDQVDRALHSALRTLESERRWLWLENLEGALTVGTAGDSLELPASVKAITSLAFLTGTTGYDILTQEPVQRVRQMARGAATGSPQYYGRSDRTLYFDCPVAVGDELEIIFTSRCPVDLADAIATPPVTLELQAPAIVAWAAAHVALTYLKNDEEHRRQNTAYEKLLAALITEEDTARADTEGGGCVQPDDGYFLAAHGY